MAMNARENYLRCARFEGPEWIPGNIHVSAGSWYDCGEAMEEAVLRHPQIWPGYEKGSGPRSAEKSRGEEHERKTDPWGSVWEMALDGLEGVVVEPALADWADFEGYTPPDPDRSNGRVDRNWERDLTGVEEAKAAGRLVSDGLDHGFFFMRLYYLRGFENLMMDLATRDERLRRLVEMVEAFNLAIVKRCAAAGVDVVSLPEDLGTQTASMISPAMFAEWVAPTYARLIAPAHEAGALVHMHTDGYIMEIVDQLLAAGVDIINPQDLVNGIDDLAREVKGKACIHLDIDRQTVMPFGSPAEVRDLVEEAVRKLGSPEGGLMLIAGIYPPTPPENVDALASAFEEFRTYWSGR